MTRGEWVKIIDEYEKTGMSCRAIARKYDVSDTSVRKWAKKLGKLRKTRTNYSKELKEKVIKEYYDGTSYMELAKKYGVDYARVNQWVRASRKKKENIVDTKEKILCKIIVSANSHYWDYKEV